MPLTWCRASILGQAVPCEVVHCWVALTAAGQGQRPASVHDTGGTSQN